MAEVGGPSIGVAGGARARVGLSAGRDDEVVGEKIAFASCETEARKGVCPGAAGDSGRYIRVGACDAFEFNDGFVEGELAGSSM